LAHPLRFDYNLCALVWIIARHTLNKAPLDFYLPGRGYGKN